jgi:hypothetical protein
MSNIATFFIKFHKTKIKLKLQCWCGREAERNSPPFLINIIHHQVEWYFFLKTSFKALQWSLYWIKVAKVLQWHQHLFRTSLISNPHLVYNLLHVWNPISCHIIVQFGHDSVLYISATTGCNIMSVVIKCADNRFWKRTTAINVLEGLTGVFDIAEGGI